jgi:hypothetical protein
MLGKNRISSIHPLGGLYQLDILDLHSNQISTMVSVLDTVPDVRQAQKPTGVKYGG